MELETIIGKAIEDYDPKNKISMAAFIATAVQNNGYEHTITPCPWCETITDMHFVGCGRKEV